MHTHIHYFSHTHSITFFAIRMPSVSVSYFVLCLLASAFKINSQCWSWCCWHGFTWRGLCWDICKSPARSPTSASPAKERCSHAQHRSTCSVCFRCLISFCLSIHPSIYLPIIYLPTYLYILPSIHLPTISASRHHYSSFYIHFYSLFCAVRIPPYNLLTHS